MATANKIRLGVNIDHAATLRQVRGGTTVYPDLLSIAKLAVRGGAGQITIHLREDRRHIQDEDVRILCKHRPCPINLEMAATDEMVKIALKHRPDWVCLVPEKRKELTTEGGLNVHRAKKKLLPLIEKMQRIGIEVSVFIEPSIEQVEAAYEVGADAIELHTGQFVLLTGQARSKEWSRLVSAAESAHELGLGVHAGHGLDFETSIWMRKLPHLREANIGHSLICYSLEMGIEKAVAQMRKSLGPI